MYKYKAIKESSKGAERELAKLYLNNLYGKFSANDSSSYKRPFINNKNVLGFEIIEEHEKKPGYIAIGSAITSYARRFVINAAQAIIKGQIGTVSYTAIRIPFIVAGILKTPRELRFIYKFLRVET